MSSWYVEVIVHAVVPAGNNREALEKVCDLIRSGIGEEGPEGTERPYRTAIAASKVYDEDRPRDVYIAHNEAWLARQRGIQT